MTQPYDEGVNVITRVAQLDSYSHERALDGDGKLTGIGFRGHAAVFNQETLIGSKRFGFVEEIAPGAFADVLHGDTRFLHNHNADLLLARTASGTLRLAEDGTGLEADADLAPTTLGRDLEILLDRGDVSEMSFAFVIADESWTRTSDDHAWPDMDKRTIVRVEALYDVSTVAFPAYGGTDAGLRLRVSDEEIRAALRAVSEDDELVVRQKMELEARRLELLAKKHA